MTSFPIIISKGTIIIDADDLHFFEKNSIYVNNHGYCVLSKWFNGTSGSKRLHRLIMNAPDYLCVDHVNGNKLDNRKVNLRLCSIAENSRNKKCLSKTGYKGVRKDPAGWRAYMEINGVYTPLGTHRTPESAALAYNKAAKVHYGEFAKLNRIIDNG